MYTITHIHSLLLSLCLDMLISPDDPVPPIEFIMTHYSTHKKKKKDEWYSPPFYTGPGGYKMCIRVDAWGYGISVHVHLMRGERDSRL